MIMHAIIISFTWAQRNHKIIIKKWLVIIFMLVRGSGSDLDDSKCALYGSETTNKKFMKEVEGSDVTARDDDNDEGSDEDFI